MTDLLSDTGEHRLIGEHTQPLPVTRFRPLPPGEITAEVKLIEPMIGGFAIPPLRPAAPEQPTQPQPSTPPNPNPPAPRPPVPPAYVGRHRAPDDMPATVPSGRWGALRSVLATAWARVRGAM